MDLLVTVVVLCVLSQVLGSHRGAEPSDASSETTKLVSQEGVKFTSSLVEEKKTTEKEDPGKKSPGTSLATKLKARLQADSPSTSKESEDDSVRATRQTQSPNFQHMSFGKGPHTTTVCIQVRSDQHPQVICGPQINDEAKAPPPAAARFSPYDYTRAAPQAYPQAPPAPGRGYPMRRTEEDLPPMPMDPSSHPASGFAPQNAQSPHRGVATPAQHVYVQRQLYQPVFASGVSPLQALMRLNCAVEPSGQILGPQLIRGSPAMYQDIPISQEVFTLPDGSPAKFGPNVVSPPPLRAQGYASPQTTQMRSSEDMSFYDFFGAQAHPYPEESYGMDMMQGRSAGGAYGMDMMQGRTAGGAYPGYAAEFVASPAAEDAARREFLQLQALRESKDKLQDIQLQLAALREPEDLQNMSSKNSSESSKDPSTSGISIEVKELPTKAKKRQTRS